MALTRVTRTMGVVAQDRYGTVPLAPPSVPGPVRNLTVLTISYNGVTLSWDAPITGGLPTSYRGRYSTDGGTTWSSPQTLASSPATLSLPDPETAYLVEVAAINLTGQGLWSDPLSFTTPEAPQPPGQATALTAGSIRRTSFTTTWTDPVGSVVTSYNRQWRVGAGSWTTETGVTKGSVMSGLTAGTAVEWQVQCVNDVGAGAWSASQTTTTTAQFVVPTVTGMVDWRNMMESVAASRYNWSTLANGPAIVGTPTMQGGGVLMTGGSNYVPGVNEALTQTVYVVGKLVADVSGSSTRPVLVGSRVSNSDMGNTIYPASSGTPAAIDVRQYAGYTDGTNSGASAGVATLNLSGLTILRGQIQDGTGLSFSDITHSLTGTPVANVKARKLSANQPLNYGHAGVAAYTGQCVLACVVVVNAVPTGPEDTAIIAAIRAEMAYWGVSEGQ